MSCIVVMIDSNGDSFLIAIATAIVIFLFTIKRTRERFPRHNAALNCTGYFDQLLRTENDAHFKSMLRMGIATFSLLVKFLRENSDFGRDLPERVKVSSEIKVAIFLQTLMGHTLAVLGDRWNLSTSTISRIIHEVLEVMKLIKIKEGMLPKAGEIPAGSIYDNGRYKPYFNGCIGALDGTHVPAMIKQKCQTAYRNRKGALTQNILGVVNFDLTFSYILAGWEGSAHDGKVLKDAIGKGLSIPDGKYYLGDAGYALTSYCITPYRGERYHLKEWRQSKLRPKTAKELFNLRHSSLRNCVERAFGVVKKRFAVLTNMHGGFDYDVQISLAMSAFLIHNFIIMNSSYADEYVRIDDLGDEQENVAENGELFDRKEAGVMRQEKANSMWEDYNQLVEALQCQACNDDLSV